MAAPRRWLWVHAGTLAVGAVVLIVSVRGQWFFADEWDFLVLRGLHHASRGLLEPHNEHWSTLPILWYRGLFSLVGLKSYSPYLASLFAVHLAAMHALWRIAIRCHVSPLVATSGVCVFGLFGSGSENLLWAFQLGFVGSLAAGLCLVLALDDDGSRRRVIAVAAGAIGSLMISGISVVMVVALGIAALGRGGWRTGAAVTAPAAAAYLLWLQGPGGDGLNRTAENSNGVRDIAPFVWGGFRAALGEPLHSRTVGGVVAVALALVFVAGARAWWRRAPEVVALAVAAIVMYAVISQGRGAIQPPDVSRYRYLAFALALPFLLLLLATAAERVRAVEIVAVLASVALVVTGTATLRTNARTDSAVKRDLREQFLASIAVAAREPTLSDKPDYMFGSGVGVEQLRRLRDHGRLPAWSRTARGVAGARLALEVDAAPSTSAGPHVICVKGDPTSPGIYVGPDAHEWAFRLRADRPAVVQLFLVYGGGAVGPRTVTVPARKTTLVRATLRTPLLVRVTSGEVGVCGAGARQ
jgi:hypothetical protein